MAVDVETGVLVTINDQSKPSSTMISLFGNPNDYAWRLPNTTDLPISLKRLRSSSYGTFHALAVNSRMRMVYFGDNALGIIAYSSVYMSITSIRYFYVPPITKQVNFTVVSLTQDFTSYNLTTSMISGCKTLEHVTHV